MKNYRLIIAGEASRLMSRPEAYAAINQRMGHVPMGTVLTVVDRKGEAIFTRTAIKGA